MSRKRQGSMLRDGHKRKSPRFSYLDEWKKFQHTSFHLNDESEVERDSWEEDGPPSRTRTRMRRKYESETDDVVSKTNQIRDDPDQQNHSTSYDKARMPEKRVLELIIDILQRRDSYEIFAEPVDPDEVEDYYEIIKEPMDFGTMRAKLHEGMYENLEQFEHDAFLISTNAMHFNSTATVYFKQARAIYELAKRVFHVLKTDPKNFELEFSGSRRRSNRRLQNEVKDSGLPSDVIPSGVLLDECHPSDLAVYKRSKKGSARSVNTASPTSTTSHAFFSASIKDGRKPNFVQPDRCATYRPWKSSCTWNGTSSSISHSSPELILTNGQDINYKESLMQFVKDLGPNVQMIAKQKLEGWKRSSCSFQTQSSKSWLQPPCQLSSALLSVPKEPDSVDTLGSTAPQKFPRSLLEGLSFFKASGRTSSTTSEGGESVCAGNRTNNNNSLGEGHSDRFRESSGICHRISDSSRSWKEKTARNGKITDTRWGSCGYNSQSGTDVKSAIRGSNGFSAKSKSTTVDMNKLDDTVRPVVLALEHTHSNIPRNKKSYKSATSCSVCSPSIPKQVNESKRSSPSDSRVPPALRPDNGVGRASLATQPSDLKKSTPLVSQLNAPGSSNNEIKSLYHSKQCAEMKRPLPPVFRFYFDMPFLKARLDQMNLLKPRTEKGIDTKAPSISEQGGQNRALNCMSQAEPSTKPFLYNVPRTSPDIQKPNLALQL